MATIKIAKTNAINDINILAPINILLKLLLLPLTIKQQKTLKKSQKVQVKLKEIQDKYKNNSFKNIFQYDTLLWGNCVTCIWTVIVC